MIKIELTEKEKQELTEDEIELAIARKLEIMILPHIRRNMQFFYAGGDLKGKANAYREKYNVEQLEEAIKKEKPFDTVCKPLCDLLAQILRENGINAESISSDTDIFKHTDVLVTTKNGKKYIINYLEDMEMIQTGMTTPNFASEGYYNWRYKKFEGGLTTDGKSIDGTCFLPQDRLSLIDNNLGFKQYGMYMNEVIKQIRTEFENFTSVMVENEFANIDVNLPEEEKHKIKKQIQSKYEMMSDDEKLEQKLDWIFNYFNDRGNITGHTDFVMYYKLLLQEVLSKDEYKKLSRYDCFVTLDKMPKDSKIKDLIDLSNSHRENRSHFCMVKLNNTYYAFSTTPYVFEKLTQEDIEKMKEYSVMFKATKPSDLVILLQQRGNALPLVFHPLGGNLLNERAELIDKNLSEEERKLEVQKLSDSIKTTDEPVTSILIPYPDGTSKLMYIDENDEYVMQEGNKKTVFHFNIEDETFNEEIIEGGDER